MYKDKTIRPNPGVGDVGDVGDVCWSNLQIYHDLILKQF